MLHTLPDLVGNGSAQPLIASLSRTPVNWIQFTVPTANTAAVRVGDQNVSANRGASVPANGLQFSAVACPGLDLSQMYFFAASNDKLQVTYGVV